MKRTRFIPSTAEGFTLAEVLIVVAIIGLLASIVLVGLRGNQEEARLAKGQSFDAQIYHALGSEVVGSWMLDDGSEYTEGSALKTRDVSGYGNDGTLFNVSLAADRAGQANKAYWFNGQTSPPGASRITLSNLFSSLDGLLQSGFSASLWFNADSFGQSSAGRFLMRTNDNTNKGFDLHWEDAQSGRIRLIIDFDTTDGRWRTTNIIPNPLNTWHHLVATYDGGTAVGSVQIYVDGTKIPVTRATNPSGITTNIPSIPLQIGAFGSGQFPRTFHGTIDDVRVYSRILTAQEIMQYYAETAPAYLLAAESGSL